MTDIDWTAVERRFTILANFLAVADDLKKQAGRRLRDVMVSLAEDNRTVMAYANWGDDAAMCSSFTLPEPLVAEDFDADRWRKFLESC